MTTPRDQILAALRGTLDAAPGIGRADRAAIAAHIATPQRHEIPGRVAAAADLTVLFEDQITAVDGTVQRVATMADVPASLAAYLQHHNLPADLVMAPDPALDAVPWDATPLLRIQRRLPTSEDMVGVTSAAAAVAETGTLVATSGPHHPSALNFVPETHIVVLPAGKVVGCYEDVWDSLRRAAAGAPLPRAVTFISGPSRTGDIEQTITLGAHGPRRLHVILVDDNGRQ